MTAGTGQNLRRAGLLLEAICMFGLISVARGQLAVPGKSGIDPTTGLSVGLGFGFVLWLVGTVGIHRARRRAREGC